MANLADHFHGVSVKRLSVVEASRDASNQHEFNGTRAMKDYLGSERRTFSARFIYLGDDENDRLGVQGEVTWYDAREQHPRRSEYRLYFRDNEVMDLAGPGDVVLMALRNDGTMLLVVASSESASLGELLWLFGVPHLPGEKFETIESLDGKERPDALFNFFAEEMGLEISRQAEDQWLGLLLERFGSQFPSTREISGLAIETLGDSIPLVDDPDLALMQLMDREEALFRQLERHIVGNYLADNAQHWASDVDAFVKFSLGVHNRRKSRAGHALENHLELLFLENHIKFDRGAYTEDFSKPDFLFPGKREYDDEAFAPEELTMLGVKTSCKDRWRQVLSEAVRIPRKHLFTLQPGISENQTREMRNNSLTLVLPRDLHTSYTPAQQSGLLTLSDFIETVRDRQTCRG